MCPMRRMSLSSSWLSSSTFTFKLLWFPWWLWYFGRYSINIRYALHDRVHVYAFTKRWIELLSHPFPCYLPNLWKNVRTTDINLFTTSTVNLWITWTKGWRHHYRTIKTSLALHLCHSRQFLQIVASLIKLILLLEHVPYA